MFTVAHAQDDFWSSSTPVKTNTTNSAGSHESGAFGLYGLRDPSTIYVEPAGATPRPVGFGSAMAQQAQDYTTTQSQGTNASIKDQMTNWDKLMEKGEQELRKFVESEVKKYVKDEIRKAVGREAGKALGNQMGGMAGELAGDILFGNEAKQAAEAERQAQLEAERVARRQKEIMEEYRAEFRSLLVDNNLSVVPLVPQTLVCILNLEEGNAISFSLFNLEPNSYGELPYKIDLMADYQEKTGKTQSYLYGPFKSVDQAREEIQKVAFMAFLGFYEVRPDVSYSFGKTATTPTQTTPAATNDDFWGTTKKSGN